MYRIWIRPNISYGPPTLLSHHRRSRHPHTQCPHLVLAAFLYVCSILAVASCRNETVGAAQGTSRAQFSGKQGMGSGVQTLSPTVVTAPWSCVALEANSYAQCLQPQVHFPGLTVWHSGFSCSCISSTSLCPGSPGLIGYGQCDRVRRSAGIWMPSR